MYFDQRTRAAIRASGLDTAETTQTSEPTVDAVDAEVVTAEAVAVEGTPPEPAVGSTLGATAYDRIRLAYDRVRLAYDRIRLAHDREEL